MIEECRRDAAILAIQAVMIRGRAMAQQRASHDELERLMDGGEYLVALIFQPGDQTERFRSYLAEMAETLGCGVALNKFDRSA